MEHTFETKQLRAVPTKDLTAGMVVQWVMTGDHAQPNSLVISTPGLIDPVRSAIALDPLDAFQVRDRDDHEWERAHAIVFPFQRLDARFDPKLARLYSKGGGGELVLDRTGAFVRVIFEHQAAYLSLQNFAVVRELQSTKPIYCSSWSLVGVISDTVEQTLFSVSSPEQ